MIVAACPSCRENVTVPVDARPSSIVRCPLCNAECRLEEFLAQLPPPLIVVNDADAGLDEAADLSAPRDTTSASAVAFDTDSDLASDEQLPAFDFTPASVAEDLAGPRELVRRPVRRQASTVWEIVKIVGGALLAVPAAQIILWWCVPYAWKRDLLGIGPSVSRVMPWVVPTKFHDVSNAVQRDAAGTSAAEETALAEAGRRFSVPPHPWRSKLPEPGAGGVESTKDQNAAPTVVDLTSDVPAGAPGSGIDRDVPPPRDASAQPAPEPSRDAARDRPSGPADPSERRAADEPRATASSATGLPRYSAADLQVALELALQASVAWDTSPDQTPQQQASLTEEFYRSFAHLGEITALLAPGDPNTRELADGVRGLLASFETQPKKLAMIGNRTAEWLDQPSRPNQGIFLFGTVGQIQPRGELFATELELASLKQRTISVVSRIDPTGFYAPGDRVLMLGATVPDPAQKLPGYEGPAEMVVLGGFPMRLR